MLKSILASAVATMATTCVEQVDNSKGQCCDELKSLRGQRDQQVPAIQVDISAGGTEEDIMTTFLFSQSDGLR
jgi:hypothetical protein